MFHEIVRVFEGQFTQGAKHIPQTCSRTDGRTDRQTDGWTQTDRQTDRQKGSQAGRQTDRQTVWSKYLAFYSVLYVCICFYMFLYVFDWGTWLATGAIRRLSLARKRFLQAFIKRIEKGLYTVFIVFQQKIVFPPPPVIENLQCSVKKSVLTRPKVWGTTVYWR